MNKQITATVGLPMFRARPIAFIALESLARQVGIDFDWELIVIEEPEDAFTEGRLLEYRERLAAVGCQRIEYIALDEWIPLSEKWRGIAAASSATSKYLVLHAADCYSQPSRLTNTHQLFASGEADWVQSALGPFFDISTGKMSVFDYELTPPLPKPHKGWERHPTALNMALRLDLLRKLAPADVRRGVDGWLFYGIQDLKGSRLEIAWDRDENWRRGADTHGFNQISAGRAALIDELRPPFRSADDLAIGDVLPAEILSQLTPLRMEATEHLLAQLKTALADASATNTENSDKLENFRGMIARRDEKIAKLEAKVASLKAQPAKRGWRRDR